MIESLLFFEGFKNVLINAIRQIILTDFFCSLFIFNFFGFYQQCACLAGLFCFLFHNTQRAKYRTTLQLPYLSVSFLIVTPHDPTKAETYLCNECQSAYGEGRICENTWDRFQGIALGNVLASASIAIDHPVILGPDECQTRSGFQLLVRDFFFSLSFSFLSFFIITCLKVDSLPHHCMFSLLMKPSSWLLMVNQIFSEYRYGDCD